MLIKVTKSILAKAIYPFAILFFDKKYLSGKFFTTSFVGWRWTVRSIFLQKILGFNRKVPWPVSPFISVGNYRNIFFDPNDLNNFQTFGCYFQCDKAKIIIGSGTYIAPNVGIITANHSSLDPDLHTEAKDVVLGKKCWIGMNAVLLPGVVLGDHTTVAAGAVVSKSFPEGYVVLAGVPARPIKRASNTTEVIDENK